MRNRIIEALQEVSGYLKNKYPVKSMAVFGSSVREDFKENSDVDIVVDFQSDDFLLFNNLAEELEVILGKKIDLITLRSLKPRHLQYIQNQMIYV